uniref:Uncharacterized protein n=1 Tax=Triticum urartu TaxID=4572 RepID=A0A8R7JZT4_TRIUA
MRLFSSGKSIPLFILSSNLILFMYTCYKKKSACVLFSSKEHCSIYLGPSCLIHWVVGKNISIFNVSDYSL